MSNKSPETVRTETVRLRVTTSEREWLEQTAADEERSISSVLRLALRKYMEARDGDRD